jgi:hypothetical protein
MGMVPLADMFNHSTDAEHVHVEGNNSDDDEDEEADDAEKECVCPPRGAARFFSPRARERDAATQGVSVKLAKWHHNTSGVTRLISLYKATPCVWGAAAAVRVREAARG